MNTKMKINEKNIIYIIVATLVVVALLSFFLVGKITSSAAFYQPLYASLDAKRNIVMRLIAGTTAASSAITVIPGDIGTPLANKMADLSGYFLIVLCAIYLEKYLLTLTGVATFKILVPLACLFYGVSLFVKKESLKQIAFRCLLLGAAIFLVIPTSVYISDKIEKTFNDNIQETLNMVEEQTSEENKEETTETTNNTGGWFSNVVTTVTANVTEMTSKWETTINNYVEAVAVMIVTSCLIPIIVIFFFAILIKNILNINTSGGGLMDRF